MKKNQVINQTKWMEKYYDSLPFKIRLLALELGYTEETIPKCYNCGNPVGFAKDYHNKFNEYCSDYCAKKGRKKKNREKFKQLWDYDWLYKKRIDEKLSKENIAKLIGCSVTLVNDALNDLNIPNIKYNESTPLTMYYLKNKEWLYEQHKIKKRKFDDIANEIKTSPATLGRYLEYHGIISNNPNIYEREFQITSKECREVIDFIDELGIEVKINDRQILDGKEIDILIPSKNIGIEYNGIYSHIYRPNESNDSLRKDKKFHIQKTIKAQEKGIQLIHIFSDDWIEKKDIWKSIIRTKLGFSERIYARKCVVVIPNKQEKMLFLDENHIQGNDQSTIHLGLKYKGDLVSLMTFGKSRYNKNYKWELMRFSCKKNFVVIGGFSKLLKYFYERYGKSIISYADRTYSNGNVYEKNGFQLIKINDPSYYYVNLNKSIRRMHRMNFVKKRIAPNDERSEYEIMKEKGYDRIYDCGTIVFALQ